MATDPVCGMEIDEAKASKTEYEGKQYYFCSVECQEEFEDDPESFLDDVEEEDLGEAERKRA